MRNHTQSNRGRRGSALMLFCVLLPAITLIVGLAVDLTIQYIVQAQLQLATDGAARGAMRLLGTGANTTEIATEYMNANMPSGFWFNTGITPTITLSTTSTTETINVSAKATVPLFLGRLMGYGSTKVGAFSTETAYNLVPCAIGYPSGTAPAKSSAPISESSALAAFGPNFILPHGTLSAWYSDEHALTLGVRQINVKTSGGSTTTNYTITSQPTGKFAVNDAGPLAVGSTILTGDQNGTDTALYSSAYMWNENGRPLWPAVFITDITNNLTANSGDWQQGGTSAIGPNALYGTWKGAVKTVDYTQLTSGAPAISVTPDADPTKNNWTGVPDTPPGGFPSSLGYGTEVLWYVDSLGLKAGHSYRIELMIHDGDQNKSGGDHGEACAEAYM